jgi:subtilisin family serine protease
MPEPALKKLNGELRRIARERRRNHESGAGDEDGTEPQQLSVDISFRGDAQSIRDAGFDIRGIAGSTARVLLTADQLEALAALEAVLTVRGPPRVERHLDRSVPEIRADAAWAVARPGVAGDSRGQGVVIGVADSGIDVFHGAFRKPDGTTRILWLWDQVIDDAARRPVDFGYGSEYDAAAINQALHDHPDGEGLPSSLLDGDEVDTSGHGTHVAGIAAGDGSDPDRCGHPFEYVGVAPDADLIIVKMGFGKNRTGMPKSGNYLHAVEYIFHKAGAQPCVVNLSLGGHYGPHNGAGSEDKRLRDLMLAHEALGTMLGNGTKMIVAAAGNDRNDDLHAFVSVAPGATESIRISTDDVDELGVFISQNGDASVECRVNFPERPSRVRMTGFVGPQDDRTHTAFDDHTIHFIDFTPEPEDPDEHFEIVVSRTTEGEKIENGTWLFELKNTGAAGGPTANCHLWIYRPAKGRGVACEPPTGVATSPQDDNRSRKRPASWIASTVSIPGTADSVITVGAYSAEYRDRLARFTNQGPTVDGRPKPEISAPGVGIDSAKANARPCFLECECCVDRYWPKHGTSMAAPHVAGVVALMLAQNPQATGSDLITTLQTSSRAAPSLPAGWPDSFDLYGVGLVDALAAVTAVNRAAGGSAPEPPPAPSPFVALPRPAFDWDWRARVRAWNEPFGAQPAWQLFTALVSEHFDEVQRLVNGNKRIAVVWRRNGGPALLRHLLALAPDAEIPIPAQIGAHEPARLLAALLRQLERCGSAALRADARRHAAFALALPGARIADLDRLVTGAEAR